ncbi:MAG: hypothetical protein KIT24_05210 [Phycisphaeraceae bacterium]|nr:hypothetical protein [Phycisphaeraceae bacterium]
MSFGRVLVLMAVVLGCACCTGSAVGPELRLEVISRARLTDAEVPAFSPEGPWVIVAAGQGIRTYAMDARGELRQIRDEKPGEWLGGVFEGADVTHVVVHPVHRGVAAATLVPRSFATERGGVVLWEIESGRVLGTGRTGFNPDSCAFTADGALLVIADEGEPDGAINPPGSVTLVDVGGPRAWLTGIETLAIAEEIERVGGIRVHPNTKSLAEDLEPEYVAIMGDRAFVTCQENNAVLVVNLRERRCERLIGLGIRRIEADVSDRDGRVGALLPMAAMPMPDQIAAVEIGGRRLLVTADEGDDRGAWGSSVFGDVARLGELVKSGAVCDSWLAGRDVSDVGYGRVRVCAFSGKEKGCIKEPVMPGSRSTSLWDADTLELLDHTGSWFEEAMAEGERAAWFNASRSREEVDSRSDDRGPEPEGVVIGKVGGRWYAFVTLERPGAIAMMEIDAERGRFRRAGVHLSAADGDFGPEGAAFVPASESPTGGDVLIVAFEASGTVVVYAVSEGVVRR